MVCLTLEKVIAIFIDLECRVEPSAEVTLGDFGMRLSLFVQHHRLKSCASETVNVTVVPPHGTQPADCREYLRQLVNITQRLSRTKQLRGDVSYKKPFFKGIGLKCLPTTAYLRHIAASELKVRRVVKTTGEIITVPLSVLLLPGSEHMWGVDAGIQRLGSGSFAVVVLGTLKGNDGEEGQEVAIKIMKKQGQLSEIHAADEATGSLVFNQLQGARTLPILGGGSTTLAALNRALTACCCLLDCFGWMLNIFKNNSPPAALCTASSICSGCFKCNNQETLSKAFSSIPALSAAPCSNGLT